MLTAQTLEEPSGAATRGSPMFIISKTPNLVIARSANGHCRQLPALSARRKASSEWLLKIAEGWRPDRDHPDRPPRRAVSRSTRSSRKSNARLEETHGDHARVEDSPIIICHWAREDVNARVCRAQGSITLRHHQ